MSVYTISQQILIFGTYFWTLPCIGCILNTKIMKSFCGLQKHAFKLWGVYKRHNAIRTFNNYFPFFGYKYNINIPFMCL